jgi:uncharacterized membrane protein
MGKARLEAFSDGVIAVIITIMVLEMKVPHGDELATLQPVIPVFISYALSFVYVGIYWNNHHHMLHAAGKVNGVILWANLHLLFWMSLVPFVTGWMGENHFAPTPSRCTARCCADVRHFVLHFEPCADPARRREFDDREGLGRRLQGNGSPS